MNTIRRPVGGGFLKKEQRNENLRQYHLRHPEITHKNLARIFKISRARVTQILNDGSHRHDDCEVEQP